MRELFTMNARLKILYEPDQRYYTTTIKESGENSFIVNQPKAGNKGLMMPQYSSWQICLLGEDAVYFFNSKVVDVISSGDINSYVIKYPDRVFRQQRRGYVRVPSHHNILYWQVNDIHLAGFDSAVIIQDYLEELETRVPGKTAFSLDISGSGLRMVTLEPLTKHSRLLLKINVGEQLYEGLLTLEAMVVRVVPLNIGTWSRYRVGVNFLNLDDKMQERIVSFLFRLMRQKTGGGTPHEYS